MSSYYETAYKKRLNRYGLDYQSRIQNQRERDFDNYLYKSIYRVDFEYNGELVPGSLEHDKQDYSETRSYLLTKIDMKIPGGTVLQIQSRDGNTTPWMIWWLEQIESSGYNRYVVLKMTHLLEWMDEKGRKMSQWSYFSGPGTAAIQDIIRSSSAKPIYSENNNLHTFITTYNAAFGTDFYFEVETNGVRNGFVVKETDINSTPGISYVTIDPVPIREKTKKPVQTLSDKKEDYFWLNGGAK